MLQFRESDAEILASIIDSANQRHLKQSRINHKSSLNILRVLSAFKEAEGQYANRKDHIYNWIMYLTKNYNPQNHKQWLSAIGDLANMGKSTRKSHSGPRNQGPGCVNKTVNDFCYSHSNYEEETGLNYHNSQWLARDTPINQVTQSRLKQYRQHEFHRPTSSNMHYISFEPECDNKENVNSHNTSKMQRHYENKSVLPTRTPVEQSFINHLPLSCGSPYVTSKITNNTKEITDIECEEQYEITEEDQCFRKTAEVYHQINLKMKGFSALLANFQAFEQFQTNYCKGKEFQYQMGFKKFIDSFHSYMLYKSERQIIFRKAQKHYEGGLIKKSFTVLNALYQLKITKNRQKAFSVQKLVPANYQFLLALLFSHQQENEQTDYSDVNDTPKSIRHKSRHYLNQQNHEKIQIICQYFVKHFRMSKEQIFNFFKLYNNARKLQTFNVLRANVRSFSSQSKQITLMRKRMTLQDFSQTVRHDFLNKGRILMMRASTSRKSKNKCFKLLLENALSRKVYQKRFQYLQSNHCHIVLKQLFGIWLTRKHEREIKKLDVLTRVEKACQIVKNFICNKQIRALVEYSRDCKQQEQTQQKKAEIQICKQIFNVLKNRVHEKRIFNQIKIKTNNSLKKKLLLGLIKTSKLLRGLNKIQDTVNKSIVKTVIKNLSIEGSIDMLDLGLKTNRQRTFFRQLRISYNLDVGQMQTKVAQTQAYVKAVQTHILLRVLKADFMVSARQKAIRQIQEKADTIGSAYTIARQKLFLSRLSSDRSQNRTMENKRKIMKSVMGDRIIKPSSQQPLPNTFVRDHRILKRQFFQDLAYNHQLGVKELKLTLKNHQLMLNFSRVSIVSLRQQARNLRLLSTLKIESENRMKQHFLSTLKQLYSNSKQLQQRSVDKYEASLKFKSVLSLAKAIMFTETQQNNLRDSIKSLRNKKSKVKLMQNLKLNMTLQKNSQKLRKFLAISSLKSSSRRKQGLIQCTKNARKLILKSKYKIFMSKLLSQQQRIDYQPQLCRLHKKLSVMKLNNAVIRRILDRKYLYMAVKFKALNLCRFAFRALSHNTPRKVNYLPESKRHRAHEHISTSYSSI